MKLYCNNAFKRISALILVSLIAFISIVKVFHTHSHNSNTYTAAKTIGSKYNCAICDYHFIKDADNFQAAITISAPVNFLLLTSGKISDYFFTIPDTRSLRGPPVSC